MAAVTELALAATDQPGGFALTPEALAALQAQYRPVVLRGLVAHWPAVAAARAGDGALADYLIARDTGTATQLMVGPPAIGGRFFYADDWQGFNFDRRPCPLTPLLRELLRIADRPDAPALYAGSTPIETVLRGFAEAHQLPLALGPQDLRIWIGNRTRVATHFDTSDNIACVVAGRRRFTLFPPQAVGDLYVGPLETTVAGQPTSLVDPLAPDLARFPRYAQAAAVAQEAVLEPGDAILIPSLWWHHVAADSAFNVLVNCWWGQKDLPSAFAALIHALLSVRDLSPPERAGWQALFDHFVFGAQAAHAADHLPPAMHGVLGAPSSERTQLITGYLQRALGRATR